VGQDVREHGGHYCDEKHAREGVGKMIGHQSAPFGFAPGLISKQGRDCGQWRDATCQQGSYARRNQTGNGLRQRGSSGKSVAGLVGTGQTTASKSGNQVFATRCGISQDFENPSSIGHLGAFGWGT
jgi:hypothetical protein